MIIFIFKYLISFDKINKQISLAHGILTSVQSLIVFFDIAQISSEQML